MFKRLLFLLLLLVPAASYGQAPIPPLAITGYEKPTKHGDLVKLQITKTDNPPASLEDVQYDWKVFNADGSEKGNVFVTDDKKTLLFASGTKDTTFTIAVNASYLFITKDDKGAVTAAKLYTSGIITKSVVVQDDVEPGPTPTPEPVIPDSKFKLVAVAYNQAKSVTSNLKVQAAQALANSYSTTAADINSGKIKSLTDAYNQVKTLNESAFAKLGEPVSNWSAWNEAIKTSVYQLYQQKQTSVLTDYAEVFSELAQGLSLVKN